MLLNLKRIECRKWGGAGTQSIDTVMRIYIKNAIVSLASAKICNPDARCIFCCDFSIEDGLRSAAEKAGIEICHVPFGKYRSGEEFVWDINQYKFDTMAYILEIMNDGDNLMQLDPDTVCISSFDEIWEEASTGLIMYTVGHGYYNENKRIPIRNNYKKLYGSDRQNVAHLGGEFLAGSKTYIEKLFRACVTIMEKAWRTDGLDEWDDEHIKSIAVEEYLKKYLYPGSPYICRYWTNQFYLVSTNYYYNAVKIWHLPAEKKFGMITLYNYYARHGFFPSVERMAQIIGLPGTSYKCWNPYKLWRRFCNKFNIE